MPYHITILDQSEMHAQYLHAISFDKTGTTAINCGERENALGFRQFETARGIAKALHKPPHCVALVIE
jgi:hypothetical protein